MKTWKPILILVISVAVIVAAVAAYRSLAARQKSTAESTTSASGTPQSGNTASAGKVVYDFTVYDVNGKEVRLSDYKGKKVVLNCWASWCGYCKAEMPDFQEAYRKYGNQVVFLMVNMTAGGNDTKETAKEYVSSEGFTFPILFDLDGSAASVMSVRSYPTTFFFNKDGTIQNYNNGMLTSDALTADIEELIQA